MTQTFSEILEEKLNAHDSFSHEPAPLFYSGTVEYNRLEDLILQGFPSPQRPYTTQYTVAVKPAPDYEFNPSQRQAVDFFNTYLQGYLQLKGPFSDYKLQRVYRLLAKKLHPDVGGSAELFRELHTGYKILLDFISKIK